MDARPILNQEPSRYQEEGESCPRCDERWDGIPAVEIQALGSIAIRRCQHCGLRGSSGEADTLRVFDCTACGLPFGDPELLPRAARKCQACRDGAEPPEEIGREFQEATEAEIRAAVGERWDYVSNADLARYLDRLLRQVAEEIDGAPDEVTAVVVDDWRWRTLALPSGTILVSLGTLDFLQDEAELAFVLGRELAHSAAGRPSSRLARLGLDGMARDGSEPDTTAWALAAEDLLRLGYGREAERQADVRAYEAVRALRYDPASVTALIARIGEAITEGNPNLAELAVSQPPASDRGRRIEQLGPPSTDRDVVLRVNREVFRRAAGSQVLRERVVHASLDEGAGAVEPRRRGHAASWWVAVAALVAVAGAVAWLLTH